MANAIRKRLRVALLLAPIAAPAATLSIHVNVPARLEVRTATAMYQCKDALRNGRNEWKPGRPPYAGSFNIDAGCSLDLPAGQYTVIAEHGLEFNRSETTVSLKADDNRRLDIQLKPWIEMQKRGWYSGDLHIHRPPEMVPQLARTEDLNVSVDFTMWNKENYWKDHTPPTNPILKLDATHIVSLMNAEDERGGGAWMIHGLPAPMNIAVPGRWFPAGLQFIREALALRPANGVLPWLDLEKPIWWEVPVVMALSPADSMGVVNNHVYQYGFEEWDAWGRPRDKAKYPGIRGLMLHCMDLYYRYLNLGFRLPPTAGSASGVKPAPIGYNRVYVKVPGEFTLENWYRALKRGDNFATNGPILFVDRKKSVISVEALAREPIEKVELIANGQVLASKAAPENATRLTALFDIDPKRYSWAAVRCFLKTADTVRFAHSSAIYLDGKYDARADARYFVEWIDDLVRETNTDPKRALSDAERTQLLGVYAEARKVYVKKSE